MNWNQTRARTRHRIRKPWHPMDQWRWWADDDHETAHAIELYPNLEKDWEMTTTQKYLGWEPKEEEEARARDGSIDRASIWSRVLLTLQWILEGNLETLVWKRTKCGNNCAAFFWLKFLFPSFETLALGLDDYCGDWKLKIEIAVYFFFLSRLGLGGGGGRVLPFWPFVLCCVWNFIFLLLFFLVSFVWCDLYCIYTLRVRRRNCSLKTGNIFLMKYNSRSIFIFFSFFNETTNGIIV